MAKRRAGNEVVDRRTRAEGELDELRRQMTELRRSEEFYRAVVHDQTDLVTRFRGAGETKPVLDRMGGQTWSRTKTRIKSRMRDMADE